jgi:hypothetical protein
MSKAIRSKFVAPGLRRLPDEGDRTEDLALLGELVPNNMSERQHEILAKLLEAIATVYGIDLSRKDWLRRVMFSLALEHRFTQVIKRSRGKQPAHPLQAFKDRGFLASVFRLKRTLERAQGKPVTFSHVAWKIAIAEALPEHPLDQLLRDKDLTADRKIQLEKRISKLRKKHPDIT